MNQIEWKLNSKDEVRETFWTVEIFRGNTC